MHHQLVPGSSRAASLWRHRRTAPASQSPSCRRRVVAAASPRSPSSSSRAAAAPTAHRRTAPASLSPSPSSSLRHVAASPPSSSLRAASTPTASATASATDQDEKDRRRRDDLLRVVRDLYSALYDYDDVPASAFVSPDVVLEDDALQVALRGAQAVGDYLMWMHAGVDAGEPATATVDAAPLEKAVLAGAEAVLAHEIAAAAKKAGFYEIHSNGAEEDCVIATWVAGDDGEVRGRDEFYFAAATGAGAAASASSSSSDPPIVRIHTSRATAPSSSS